MWKMLGMTAGQVALASLANRAGQMAIDSVFDGARSDDGSRARPRIERGLRAAGREIRAGRYGSADKIVRGLSGIRADEVRQHLSGEEIRAMQAWERGETGRDPHVVGRRATLTSAERHKIPSSKFALPKERKYPIQDLAHAKSARSYATTEYQDGNLTKAQWEMVYRKTAERYPDLDPKSLVCEKKGRKKRCHSVPKGGRAERKGISFDKAVKAWRTTVNEWYNLNATPEEMKRAYADLKREKKAQGTWESDDSSDPRNYEQVFFRTASGGWNPHLDTADREELSYFIEENRKGAR